jgi:thiol:disulfide interchange protein
MRSGVGAVLVALVASAALSGCANPPPLHLEIAPAPTGVEVAPFVRGELSRARREGRPLLVYVGARWCEPCRRFHEAAAAGALDQRFPGLRLLEFDFDRDQDRLRSAGYVSQYIPLFALPAQDGRASGRQIAGSIKGDGAVGEIAPRLADLLR